MNLYEINKSITDMVDRETGEILDIEAFDSLVMERDEKLENMALWIKNLSAEATAIREEEKNLAERRKAVERKADQLKEYLSAFLSGQKFGTPRVSCSFRKSTSLEIKDEEKFVQTMAQTQRFEFLKYTAPTVDKKAVTDAIKAGQTVEGAYLIEKNNIQIK